VAGDPSTCGQLFTLATPSGGSAPTDTVGAALDILKQPTVNVSQLYALLPSTLAFTPTLSSAPASWALPITSNTTTPLTYTLYAFPESDNSVTPLYALVNNAQKTIDMTMYALEDTTFSADLVAACNRGVKVRVILDQNLEKSGNTSAYNQLNAAANCSAVWANKAFQASHQKSIILDGTQVAIMSLNLQTQYYSTTRDFALLENDPVDIAAIQATFNADYAAGTPSSGVAGASDFSYQPGAGDDLIWSPTTAQPDMLAIINGATKTVLVENEEMGASNIVSALEAASARGVTVHIAMVETSTKAPYSSYSTEWTALEAAGCGVHVYPDTTTGLYIHAKAVVADFSLPTQSVYMGSINYSSASMTENRELGVYISDPASVQLLNSAMAADYAGGTAY
jgi:phosphatidylserine/phosphatidylglycerophosphate/cardiolipin synthase-like enzyme